MSFDQWAACYAAIQANWLERLAAQVGAGMTNAQNPKRVRDQILRAANKAVSRKSQEQMLRDPMRLRRFMEMRGVAVKEGADS